MRARWYFQGWVNHSWRVSVVLYEEYDGAIYIRDLDFRAGDVGVF